MLQRRPRIEKTMKRLSLHRNSDGSIISGKAAKAADSGKALKAKSDKEARKKLRKLTKPITDKKRQKLLAKAAAIADPQQREAALTFIGKRAAKQPKSGDFIAKAAKPKLPPAVRAMSEEQLYDGSLPASVRDAAWMKLTGIPEEVGK